MVESGIGKPWYEIRSAWVLRDSNPSIARSHGQIFDGQYKESKAEQEVTLRLSLALA